MFECFHNDQPESRLLDNIGKKIAEDKYIIFFFFGRTLHTVHWHKWYHPPLLSYHVYLKGTANISHLFPNMHSCFNYRISWNILHVLLEYTLRVHIFVFQCWVWLAWKPALLFYPLILEFFVMNTFQVFHLYITK